MRRPLIPNQATAIIAGGVLTVLGLCLLYDAWEGRGARKPWLLGPILPW